MKTKKVRLLRRVCLAKRGDLGLHPSSLDGGTDVVCLRALYHSRPSKSRITATASLGYSTGQIVITWLIMTAVFSLLTPIDVLGKPARIRFGAGFKHPRTTLGIHWTGAPSLAWQRVSRIHWHAWVLWSQLQSTTDRTALLRTPSQRLRAAKLSRSSLQKA